MEDVDKDRTSHADGGPYDGVCSDPGSPLCGDDVVGLSMNPLHRWIRGWLARRLTTVNVGLYHSARVGLALNRALLRASQWTTLRVEELVDD